jgi:hypothetical protein
VQVTELRRALDAESSKAAASAASLDAALARVTNLQRALGSKTLQKDMLAQELAAAHSEAAAARSKAASSAASLDAFTQVSQRWAGLGS